MSLVNNKIVQAENKEKIPGLSMRETEVLKFLALEGPLNVYQIKQKLRLPSYSTAHGAVKALEEDGLLKMQALEKTSKGVTAKVYGLTFSGLALAMMCEDVWKNLEKVVKAWNSLTPLPLSKFEYLAKCGLGKDAQRCYRYAFVIAFKEAFELNKMLMNIFGREEHVREILLRSREDVEKEFRRIFDLSFLDCAMGAQPIDTLIKWYKALRCDKELRAWAVEMLKRKATRYHAWAGIAERNLAIIEAEQEPNWEEVKKKGIELPVEVSWQLH
jgi:DNA-binding MarR family transcriptional regulator